MAASAVAVPKDLDAYDEYIEQMRETEYPMLRDTTYLDHAGTTLYSKSLMDRFHHDMMASLYGNPHSASPSSQHSTQLVDDVRLRMLRFFGADPDRFDLIFTANATAAIKLIGDAFREQEHGFRYGYHIESHTSLVGLRELATTSTCLESEQAVASFLRSEATEDAEEQARLFAYPAQSNMNGRRLPALSSHSQGTFVLLDAAAMASTTPLKLSDLEHTPDFTVVSFYKIFGFPDLGALIVRNDAARVFDRRKYFGGGTVEMVACTKEQWHARKLATLHDRLEDGTLPIHSILALEAALQTHEELFESQDHVSWHTARLADMLYNGLASLKHFNDEPVCLIYKPAQSGYLDSRMQGPTVALNLKDSSGRWVSNAEVEKLAAIWGIHLRTGGVCNPGGVAQALNLMPWELQENFSAGHRCGGENDVMNGKPTGILRLSLGAMSTSSDVKRFIDFTQEFFVDDGHPLHPSPACDPEQRWYVEGLTVYPIKSCAGFHIPFGQPWQVHSHGLAWDREWCILHEGTGSALTQKQYPRMALLKPTLDFSRGALRIEMSGSADCVSVPLSKDPALFRTRQYSTAKVCGEAVEPLVYSSPAVSEFLSSAIGVQCVLARHNPAASGTRHCKPQTINKSMSNGTQTSHLANESPILTISRSSLNRLNEQIKVKGGKAAHPSVFRANIVVAEDPALPSGFEQPWVEDRWSQMRIGDGNGCSFDLLGGCRRCQMVCVDQCSAEKNPEPFITLAKTRRFDGRVLFGVHTALQRDDNTKSGSIKAGDVVRTWTNQG